MAQVASFDNALARIQAAARRHHLLLGNGFSIALKPDIFSYTSLFENADFSAAPHLPILFEALATTDFEIVIRHLQDTATILEIYRPRLVNLSKRLRADAGLLKDILVSAIAQRHPDRPYDLATDQYVACRQFIANFDHIFTLNYDVLLYWALMQDELDEINLRPDDGFRHPEEAPEEPYVSWQQAHSPTVHYLHGALHLFDKGSEIIKYTWSKTDTPIIEQIRLALEDDKFPVFVAEGLSETKKTRILHNAYLHKSLRSFESCTKPATSGLVIFGHSLAENDQHVLNYIAAGAMRIVAVSLYGDIGSDDNTRIIANAHALAERRLEMRGERYPLEFAFFHAESAHVWG